MFCAAWYPVNIAVFAVSVRLVKCPQNPDSESGKDRRSIATKFPLQTLLDIMAYSNKLSSFIQSVTIFRDLEPGPPPDRGLAVGLRNVPLLFGRSVKVAIWPGG